METRLIFGPQERKTNMNALVLEGGGMRGLFTAGALDALASSRRQALWAAGAAAQESPETLPHLAVGAQAPMLPGMSDAEIGWYERMLAEHAGNFISYGRLLELPAEERGSAGNLAEYVQAYGKRMAVRALSAFRIK